MNDYVIGHIRTYVPMIVGFLVMWLARELGIIIDENTEANLVAAFGGLAAALYYGLVRFLAEKWPWIGNFLGVNKAPVYPDPEPEA